MEDDDIELQYIIEDEEQDTFTNTVLVRIPHKPLPPKKWVSLLIFCVFLTVLEIVFYTSDILVSTKDDLPPS